MASNCLYVQDGGLVLPWPCNNAIGSISTITNEIEYANFGYNVTLWVAALFTGLFGLSLLIHIFQATRTRFWSMLFTFCIGTLIETIGWAGRLWAAQVTQWDPNQGGRWYTPFGSFVLQIATLIIAPAFYSAALYIWLGILIKMTGNKFSPITPRSYTILFIFGDWICIFIQAAGGGIAGSSNTQSAADNGAHIMVVGIIIQMALMVAYTLLFITFTSRYLSNRPVSRPRNLLSWAYFRCLTGKKKNGEPDVVPLGEMPSAGSTIAEGKERVDTEVQMGDKVRLLLASCAVSTVLIFVRSIFRTVELLDGWSGKIATSEVLFTCLDGLLMLLLSWLWNIIHPSYCIRSRVHHGRLNA